jgi:bifunctional non-homologous end joining protein LigD
MLLSAGAPATADDGRWAIEVKFDGIRAQLRVDGERGWCVRSRPGRDCSAQFPELATVARRLARRRVILDGELVHFAADGRPDFAALRSRLTASDHAAARAGARHPTTLVAFDVLHLDGHATRRLPYRERRALLVELLADVPGVRVSPSWTERLDDVVAVTREHELEGVVYKRSDSRYRPGIRSVAWRKLKHRREQTLAVAAWTPGDGEPDTFFLARPGANGEPVFAGAVQFGLDAQRREWLRHLIAERERPARRRRRIRPVEPGVSLVVSAHGPAGRPLRDAVIQGVIVSEPGPHEIQCLDLRAVLRR